VFGYAAFAQAPFASLGESVMPVDFADTATITDTASVVLAQGGVLVDAATMTDSVNTQVAYNVYIIDTATGTDTFSATLGYSVAFADTATISDTPSVIATINASVTGIQLYVYIGGALVWGQIDDNQNPNWQNINSAQTPGWNDLPS
jgi:hypothetical protein